MQKKNASEEHAQYPERREMPTSVTRLQENSILFVFLSSACLASHIQLCFFREDFSVNYMTNVVWWRVSIVTVRKNTDLTIRLPEQ